MADFGAQLFLLALTAWVQGVILFAVVWAAERTGLLRSPGLRQLAWRAVLVIPLLSAAVQVFATGGPMTGAQLLPAAPAAASAAATAIAAAPVAAAPAAPDVSANFAAIFAQVRVVLGWAWLAWLSIVGARLAVQRFRLAAYCRRLAPVTDDATLALVRELGRAARLPRLTLLSDPALTSPMALAPATIVVPTWATRDLNALQRRALLAHEVSHLARRDPQWRALTVLASAVLLAPYGRMARRKLDTVAEHACDAWSAKRTDGGVALAECLAACLEQGLSGRAPRWASAMAEGGDGVVERARRLLEGRTEEVRTGAWRERLAFLGLVAVTSTVLPGFAIARLPADTGATAAPAQPASPAPAVRPPVTAAPVVRVATARRMRRTTAVAPVAAVATSPVQVSVSEAAAPAVAAAPARRPVPAPPAVPPVAAMPAVAAAPAIPATPPTPPAPRPVQALKPLPPLPAAPAPPEPVAALPSLPAPPA